MTQDYKHPIAPPPQWQIDGWQARIETMGADVPSILLEVIQWGREQAETDIERERQEAADQELDACCEWMNAHSYFSASIRIREDRRPKPPSLKKQALAELAEWESVMDIAPDSPIRRALEQLDD